MVLILLYHDTQDTQEILGKHQLFTSWDGMVFYFDIYMFLLLVPSFAQFRTIFVTLAPRANRQCALKLMGALKKVDLGAVCMHQQRLLKMTLIGEEWLN